MFERRIPVWVRHAPTPAAEGFGLLAAMDAGARAILMSVFPLVLYRTLGSAELVSKVYLLVGFLGLAAALLTPWVMRLVPRRWVFTTGALGYVAGPGFMALGDAGAPYALAVYASSAVVVFVCFNAYVLDFISQAELGRCETMRCFYAAFAWTAGPVLGVILASFWQPLPFLVSALFGLALCAVFWAMRMGDGKLIRRSRGPAANPVAYLRRFAAQPRLIAGYLFAMLRSCGWWVYVVYLPIFAIEGGLGEETGGIALSLTNSLLFLTPLMLRWTSKHPVRASVRTGFLVSGVLFIAATFLGGSPWAALALLFLGSAFMILLDICGGLPFLMSVKPSERTEMSAVYSTYRDASGILTPGTAALVLTLFPVSGLFATAGAGLLAAWLVAGKINGRLGANRVRPGA